MCFCSACGNIICLYKCSESCDSGDYNRDFKPKAEASTDSDIVAQISIGDECELLEEEGDWYRVKYGEYTGYISKEYANVVGQEDTSDTSDSNNDNGNNVNETTTKMKIILRRVSQILEVKLQRAASRILLMSSQQMLKVLAKQEMSKRVLLLKCRTKWQL